MYPVPGFKWVLLPCRCCLFAKIKLLPQNKPTFPLNTTLLAEAEHTNCACFTGDLKGKESPFPFPENRGDAGFVFCLQWHLLVRSLKIWRNKTSTDRTEHHGSLWLVSSSYQDISKNDLKYIEICSGLCSNQSTVRCHIQKYVPDIIQILART